VSSITAYQVDEAYFVVDGHKRLSLAIADGRAYVDAEVTRFPTRYQLHGGTTIDAVQSTEEEFRFRERTGLVDGVRNARFPLSDPDGYLDLEESLKAHAYDISVQRGQLVPRAEAARHWYEFVFVPASALAREAGFNEMLSACTDAERFLIMRHGNRAPFGPGWEMSPGVADRSLRNLGAARPKFGRAFARLLRRRRPQADVLPERPERPGPSP
jgi:hypothetical protein